MLKKTQVLTQLIYGTHNYTPENNYIQRVKRSELTLHNCNTNLHWSQGDTHQKSHFSRLINEFGLNICVALGAGDVHGKWIKICQLSEKMTLYIVW